MLKSNTGDRVVAILASVAVIFLLFAIFARIMAATT